MARNFKLLEKYLLKNNFLPENWYETILMIFKPTLVFEFVHVKKKMNEFFANAIFECSSTIMYVCLHWLIELAALKAGLTAQ